MNRWSAAVYGALAGAMIAYPRQAAEAALEAMRLWARAAVSFFLCFALTRLLTAVIY